MSKIWATAKKGMLWGAGLGAAVGGLGGLLGGPLAPVTVPMGLIGGALQGLVWGGIIGGVVGAFKKDDPPERIVQQQGGKIGRSSDLSMAPQLEQEQEVSTRFRDQVMAQRAAAQAANRGVS